MTSRIDLATVERLHRKSGADAWGVPLQAFATALESSVQRAFSASGPDPAQLERYLTSLHLEDLALACACAHGSESAWEHFIREHRPGLYRAAAAIDTSGGARELADSLYGELFGLNERDGERRSHFRYFHGRSSLATWLRAVLSQRRIDRLRSVRRLDPLPSDDMPEAIPSAATARRSHVGEVSRRDAPGRRCGRCGACAARPSAAALLLCAGSDARADRQDARRVRSHLVQTAGPGATGGASASSSASFATGITWPTRRFQNVSRQFLPTPARWMWLYCWGLIPTLTSTLIPSQTLSSDSSSNPRKKLGQNRSKAKETSRAGRR